ncbi:MAG: hypothetical protein ACREBG_21760 [Pyrinomonadaceae bacterium]
MNRNQKIALGCGGAGCLGLIVLIAAGAIGYYAYQRRATSFDDNGNSNVNINTDRTSNRNSSTDLADNTSSSSDTSSADDTSSSTMSNDDKHKLFQAAGMTKDSELILRVLKKIGFPSGTGGEYQKFVQDHFAWAMKNLEFVTSVNTPEKARAYVDAHIND